MTKLQTLPKITFWPKIELLTCQTSHKTEKFPNMELFIPKLVHRRLFNIRHTTFLYLMIKQKKIISMVSVIRKSKRIIIFHGDKVIQVCRLDIYTYNYLF